MLEREGKWDVKVGSQALTALEVANERCVLVKVGSKHISKVKVEFDRIKCEIKNRITPLLHRILSRNGETSYTQLPSGMDVEECKAAVAQTWWDCSERHGYAEGRLMPTGWTDKFLACFFM